MRTQHQVFDCLNVSHSPSQPSSNRTSTNIRFRGRKVLEFSYELWSSYYDSTITGVRTGYVREGKNWAIFQCQWSSTKGFVRPPAQASKPSIGRKPFSHPTHPTRNLHTYVRSSLKGGGQSDPQSSYSSTTSSFTNSLFRWKCEVLAMREKFR
jgi:hypothetical protein